VQTNSHSSSYHFHLLLPKLRNRQVNLSLLSDEQKRSCTKNKRANKLTMHISLPSIFCFPGRQESKQTHNTNHFHLLLPMLQKPSSQSNQSASSLDVSEQEERRSSKHKQTREQTNSQNKSLPSSASYASKPICLFIQMNRGRSSTTKNKREQTNPHFHLLLPSHASKPSTPVKSQSISSFNQDRTASSKYIQTHTRKLTIIPYHTADQPTM